MSSPATAPLAAHGRSVPGSRRAAADRRWPRPPRRERREADLAQRGDQQGSPPIDRRQQDVRDLRLLEGQRPPAAGPQADGSGDGGDDADESGRQAAHIVDAGRREGIIADGGGTTGRR